jgi:hypothetical protein
MELCDMSSAPKEVIELIERFERNIEANESRIDELVCELYGDDKIPD